ncbi:hypothetical protein ACFONC_08940 [Luteimonas soli]|uniref:Uncharacterized protein n=1 Tax=Luteimonas soli TaxID=1648966 RepID=A0ABV7XJF1_9GAMM
MTTPATPTDHPTLTAEEIGRRFLKLIEGLESRSDLSLERAQQETGLTFNPSSDERLYGYEQALADGWHVAMNYRLVTASTKAGIDLHFWRDDDQDTDMSPVCAFDFDHYNSALKAMGYRDAPIHGEIGQLQSWRYYKNDITLSIIPQNAVAGVSGRLCVKSIGTLN